MVDSGEGSFFDDDNIQIKFEFHRPDKRDQKELSKPPVIQDTLYQSTSTSSQAQQGYFRLFNTTLAYYKSSSSSSPEAVLNIAHSTFVSLASVPATGHSGFSITKNKNTFIFSSESNSTIQNWTQILRGVCILKTFHDEYKAQKMIGKGSFAKVYLVESKSTKSTFAVKAFTKESLRASNKSNAKPAMINEIDIMRACNHENVIKLYEVFETEKSIYLVLELITGKSMQDILKKSSFLDEYSEIRIINMIRYLLDALSYLSIKGIMHRDLKPDNILVDKGDKLKIVDFGLATFIDVPEYIFKKCGTPGYIAPEVFKYSDKKKETNYDDRCDVFSAGCILYYMLFGKAFFRGSDADEILDTNRKFTTSFDSYNKIKNEISKSDGRINKDGLNLCLQLLEYDQHKRIRAQKALNHNYFVPVPHEMMKIAGSNEIVSHQLSKYNQNGNYSPDKTKSRGTFNEEVQKQLNRADSIDRTASSVTNKHDRFAEKDSLYLDMGKPEMQGRVDTMNGSQNNSLLLTSKGGADSREGSLSSFAHKNALMDQKKRGQSSSFKNSGGNSLYRNSILKSAQNGSEEAKDDSSNEGNRSPPSKMSDFAAKRTSSYGHKPSQTEDDYDFVVDTSENSKSEKKRQDGIANHPSKMQTSSNRRFNPFKN